MNPWGIVVIAVGAIIVWIGVRGTQGTLYADIFGHPYQSAGNGPDSITLPAGSSIGTNGPNGIGQQGSSGLNVNGGSNQVGNSSTGTSTGSGTGIGSGSIGTPPLGAQGLTTGYVNV